MANDQIVKAAPSASDRREKLVRYSISLLVLCGLAAAWELSSFIYTSKSSSGIPLIPGWEWLVTRGIPSLANYGGNGFGLSASQGGGAGNYHGALTVLVHHSVITWERLLAGLALGVIAGTALGLLTAWSSWGRRTVAFPGHLLRTVPLLAMIPLFQIWFGISFEGIVLFIAYGVGVILFVGVINAAGNVPRLYIDNARTLGATRLQIYRTVYFPAMFPELRSALLIGLGVAWSAEVGAEFLGAQSGLGYIVVSASSFALLDRVAVVGIVFMIYALASFVIFERASSALVQWMPRSGS